jgi:hypothetical protein
MHNFADQSLHFFLPGAVLRVTSVPGGLASGSPLMSSLAVVRQSFGLPVVHL